MAVPYRPWDDGTFTFMKGRFLMVKLYIQDGPLLLMEKIPRLHQLRLVVCHII